MGNKKIKPPHLEVVSMGILGVGAHGFLIFFTTNKKKFLLIEKKFIQKPSFCYQKRSFPKNRKKKFYFLQKYLCFFEISLYLYIRNSRKTWFRIIN